MSIPESGKKRLRVLHDTSGKYFSLDWDDPFTRMMYEWENYLESLQPKPQEVNLTKIEIGGKFYIYVVLVEGNLKYIGKGSGDRYKHGNSGVSSCYELNRDHFKGKYIECRKILEGLGEEEALILEAHYIDCIGIQELYNIETNNYQRYLNRLPNLLYTYRLQGL